MTYFLVKRVTPQLCSLTTAVTVEILKDFVNIRTICQVLTHLYVYILKITRRFLVFFFFFVSGAREPTRGLMLNKYIS